VHYLLQQFQVGLALYGVVRSLLKQVVQPVQQPIHAVQRFRLTFIHFTCLGNGLYYPHQALTYLVAVRHILKRSEKFCKRIIHCHIFLRGVIDDLSVKSLHEFRGLL